MFGMQSIIHWNVITTKKWMNTFLFLLKPLFRISHNIVMRRGGKCLAKKLGTTLLANNDFKK